MQASGLPDPSDPSRPVPPRRPTCLGVLETTLETNMGSYTTMGSTGAMSLHKAYHKARTRAGGTVAGESTEQCSAAALDACTSQSARRSVTTAPHNERANTTWQCSARSAVVLVHLR